MQDTYRASCHCGKVVAEADLDLEQPSFRCNCSICRRLGGLWGYYRPDEVGVADPEGRLVGYVQGDRTLTTWHCGRCGCTTHWSALDPAYQRAGVNLRMFEREVWEPLPRRFVDGASW